MNIICDKSKLLDGINIVLKAIPGKSTMAILECLVIEAENNIIKLIANDLEIGIEIIEKKLNDPDNNEDLIKTLDVLNKKIDPQ